MCAYYISLAMSAMEVQMKVGLLSVHDNTMCLLYGSNTMCFFNFSRMCSLFLNYDSISRR